MAEWKPGTGQKTDALYAWVATGPDGGESIVGAMLPGIPGLSPLIGADRARIESYRVIAVVTRAATGYPVRLVRFSRREDLEVLR